MFVCSSKMFWVNPGMELMLIDAWHPSAQEEVVHDNNNMSNELNFSF